MSNQLKKMNILFLMTDQHNPDYVGYAPNAKAKTPNIDWIAEGISFNAAVSPNPVCTPTRCALLTGKYPHQVGMMTMSGDLNPGYPTYPQALQRAGYFTAGIGKFHWMQGWHWSAPRGKGHNLVELHEEIKKYGFDYIWEAAGKQLMLRNYCDYGKYLEHMGILEKYRDEVERRNIHGHPEYPDTSESFGIPAEHHAEVVIADKIIEAIRNRPKDKPFCIFGSFLSPHPIIDPPEKYYENSVEQEDEVFLVKEDAMPLSREKQQSWIKNRRGYRALIHLVDDQIGRVLSALKKENELENTVIIFTSDHGDLLGDFGLDGKNKPWRESANVPLAIRHPDYITGRRVNSPVSLIDITATILDTAGLDPKLELGLKWPAWNDIVPCRSLMPVIKGEKDSIREYAFSENDEWEMIQTERYKYIRYRSGGDEYQAPVEEFFDLEKDPKELRNVISCMEYEEIIQWCRERRDFVINSTPAGQMGWAPIGASEFGWIRPKQLLC